MTAMPDLSRRGLLKAGGALVVSFSLDAAWPTRAQTAATLKADLGKTVDADEVDGFLAVHPDGSVTAYSGKVDLGTGFRIAVRQMVAEELDLPVERIALIEGDTALTPDQGPTAGSTGIQRGGVQIRQAAATARQALLRLGSEWLKTPAEALVVETGTIRAKTGGKRVRFGDLIGGKPFALKLDAKAPLKDPASYAVVGKPLPRPDLPAKLTGRHTYMHDFKLAGMLHGRVVHPPAIGAKLDSVDEASIAGIPGVRVVRIENFLGVVAQDEWAAVRAARELKASWSGGGGLPGSDGLQRAIRESSVEGNEALIQRGDAPQVLAGAAKKLSATYYWPPQSHASLGPSCAVADVRAEEATVWTASQSTHKYRPHFAKVLGLPVEQVRLVYLDGAGCYGMNGHEDAAADAAILSRAAGRPVRVQWMREDEHGWDPKGPPQLLELSASLDDTGKIAAWNAEMWIPAATKGLPNIPLLSPAAAGLPQPQGIATGLITQNADPSYTVPNVHVVAHWLKDTPLRPSNLRAPGKVANTFAVESLVDELAVAAGADPLAFRLQGIDDPRGIAVLKRVGEIMKWEPRNGPSGGAGSDVRARGRGVAYIHYKHAENYVAMGMDVTVDRGSGAVRVERVVCAHDCGLVINPDAVKNQVEGGILQTLSRALFEEAVFDSNRVTSVDWASYPILKFPDVPEVVVELIDHPELPPVGAGEAATAPVAAALANAIYDAVGVRLRQVPMTPERVKQALAHA
ncbi:MAG TPA: molybdopterin cofactor-binding domain-containing protein [Stellaceae bacterium]|nr:molybdopterin cofactor-binding domain-containing protein [Stellaceae bacterium]